MSTNLTYAYSRIGLPQTITDRTGTRTLDYHLPSATLISETLDNTYFGGRKILYKRESQAAGVLGRPLGYKLGTSALPSMDQEVTYGYENLDRLTSVSVGTANASTWNTYRYSYRADSNLIETLAVENTPFVVTRTYEEDRDLLTSIETKSTSPNTVYTKFSYTYDARRYRSTALQEGTAFADYGDATYRQFAYNGRGELTAGIGYLGSNVASQAAPLPGRRYEYAYDTIGNRQWSNSTGVSTLRDDYSVNALNQYISRENNTVSISGTAATDAVVAVKGRNVTAGRQGRFWSDEVTVPNVLGPWAGPLSVYANKSVGGSSVMRIDSRSAAIPAVAQSLTYDLDGNTLSDGLWDYQWDAENRLVRLETTVAARNGGIAHRIVNFTYDYLGRRVQKQVIDGVTVTELSSQRFIYNRWDIIAEYSVLNGSALDKLQRTYAWGVDIAGSLSNAGGVGALLQFVNSATGAAFMPSYDGNGNVASLINLGTGALAAAYEYSPYGEILRDDVLDNAASTFAFKFSTKWRDAETGWSNYGRRYYDSRSGRFIGRDPIAEEGGINLYAFCGNSPVDRWDRLGQNSYWTQILDTIRWFEEEIGIDNLTDDQMNDYTYWLGEKGRVDVFDITPNRFSEDPIFSSEAHEETIPYDLATLYFGNGVNGMLGVAPNSVAGSVLGDMLRHIPLLGGLLGGVGDVIAGVGNTALGIVSFGQSGTFGRGLGQIGSGVGAAVTILATDAAAAVVGAVGTVVTTAIAVADVFTLGNAVSGGDPLKAISNLAINVAIPEYGMFGGYDWGADQGRGESSTLNQSDVASYHHDDNMNEIEWLMRNYTTNPQAIWVGPIGTAYALLGTIPFGFKGLLDGEHYP
ncbi:MAG: RHS repeat-associated core domain-containing protein [Opitutaceae bacterium]|nr:RHS repeat-associated core domain-containing protein [Opitutaceae bacterium]